MAHREMEEIREEIRRLAGNNAEFYDKLNPTAKPSAGVSVPNLRKLAKELAKEDYKWFLENNPMDTFELEMLQGLVIGYAKDDIKTILAYLKKFIPKIHDWAVNDITCQTFQIAKKHPEETFRFFMKYKNSKKEFEVRVVSVMLMSHFMTEEYIDRALEVWDGLYAEEYYAKMGVAWAVATAAAKFPDKVYEYMTSPDNHLNDWTYQKALQKMKESYRVDNAMVEKIKAARDAATKA
ncbi:MAG: DNA alkylation repair protein [Lachnospiraceae bacterium]|nr:DNA alkylation repair protein [Lachnospiraceae bacterium]